MATLLFNYSDILFPHVVARFPHYDIINDFKKINIKLKTVVILENLRSSSTIGFMKGFLKQCQNTLYRCLSFYVIYIIFDLSRAYTGQVKSGITLIFKTVDSKWSILAPKHKGSWPLSAPRALPGCSSLYWYSSVLPVVR